MPNWLRYLTGWLRSARGVPVETFSTGDLVIHFLGEQDGAVERELKDALVPTLQPHHSVLRAYLARLRYGDELAETVALCLRYEAAFDEAIVIAVGDVFHEMFSHSQHLDIMPVTEGQERELRAVCQPFFIRTGATA